MRLVFAVMIVVLLGCSTPVQAGEVSVSIDVVEQQKGGRFTDVLVRVVAAPGERNQVTVSGDARALRVSDIGAAPVAGDGCTLDEPTVVRCPLPSVTDSPPPRLEIDAGDGDDTLTVGLRGVRVRLAGGDGDDHLAVLDDSPDGDGSDLLGGDGDDTITGGRHFDVIEPGERDIVSAFEDVDGTRHADVLIGDDGPNRFDANGPSGDRIDGRGGDDALRGAGGDDVLLGGSGDDELFGGGGIDRIDGGPGADHSLVSNPDRTRASDVRCDASADRVSVSGSSGRPPVLRGGCRHIDGVRIALAVDRDRTGRPRALRVRALSGPAHVRPCRMRTTFALRGHIRTRSPAQTISQRHRRNVAVPPRFKRGRARITIELDLGCRGPFRQPVPSTRFTLALAS